MVSYSLTVRAHAKINLCLEVLGKRADGLHEVTTVLQTITLADRLTFKPSGELSLRCRGMRAAPDNLILRAARLLQEETDATSGCAILCEKRIPVASGLGGGSADAAATLYALNHLWRTSLGLEDLTALAARLGADVPFALRGGTALASGTGSTVEPLPDAPRYWLVLVPFNASEEEKTRNMYGRLRAADFSDGAPVREQVAAIRRGCIDFSHVQSAFSRAAAERWPHVEKAVAKLVGSGAGAVSVSGAGPSVFGLYGSRAEAVAALTRVRAAGFPAQLHRFVGSAELRARQEAAAPAFFG